MSDHPVLHPSDPPPSLDDLAQMWREADPPPPGLADRLIAVLSLQDLDGEYELLTLVERTRQLLGTRGEGDALTIAFAARGHSLMMRVSPLAEGRRRVDGWVGPPQAVRVQLFGAKGGDPLECTADQSGRFEMANVLSGPVRLLVTGWNRTDAEAETPGFCTPVFEL